MMPAARGTPEPSKKIQAKLWIGCSNGETGINLPRTTLSSCLREILLFQGLQLIRLTFHPVQLFCFLSDGIIPETHSAKNSLKKLQNHRVCYGQACALGGN